MQLSNQKILIAGGGSGMGLALASRCIEAGAEVIIAGRREDRLRQAREALGNPAGLHIAAVDITREDQVAALFAGIGGLDHIVSTAADIEGAYRLLPGLDLNAAQRVVDSKLFGPLLLAKHGAPGLAVSGSMSFVSGIAAYRPAPRGSVVAAVNAALEGLVRALAIELAPIRVNAVSPGWVDTEILGASCGRQEGRDACGDGRAAAGRQDRPSRRYRRRDFLPDGQWFYDGNDTACRGRTSPCLDGSAASSGIVWKQDLGAVLRFKT